MNKHNILNTVMILFCSFLFASCARIIGYNGDRENASNIYYLKDIGEVDRINDNTYNQNYKFYWKGTNGNVYGYNEGRGATEIEEGSKEAIQQNSNKS